MEQPLFNAIAGQRAAEYDKGRLERLVGAVRGGRAGKGKVILLLRTIAVITNISGEVGAVDVKNSSPMDARHPRLNVNTYYPPFTDDPGVRGFLRWNL